MREVVEVLFTAKPLCKNMPRRSVAHKDLIEQARQLESGGLTDDAIGYYRQVLKEDPLNNVAYDRLMVIYRKQKAYRKELAVINEAIKAYEGNIRSMQEQHTKGKRKAVQLSKSLAQSLGLADRKGAPVYEDRILATWRKRKETVAGKLKA